MFIFSSYCRHGEFISIVYANIAIVVFLAIVFVVDKISSKAEEGKIKPYGQFVTVDGKNMNVLIQGQGEETVVLLPGLGTGTPALDRFKIV